MAELAQYIRMPISIHAPREGGDAGICWPV